MDHKNPEKSTRIPRLNNVLRLDRLLPIAILVLALTGILLFSRTVNKIFEPRKVPASEVEYLWYEAENMRGISQTARHEPVLNPSYLDLPAAKAPAWSISGPGVSAEWSQGGESEWNSVAAAADETHGTIWQDFEVPRGGKYKVWVRYADWASKSENFVVRILQERRAGFRH